MFVYVHNPKQSQSPRQKPEASPDFEDLQPCLDQGKKAHEEIQPRPQERTYSFWGFRISGRAYKVWGVWGLGFGMGLGPPYLDGFSNFLIRSFWVVPREPNAPELRNMA